MCGRYGLSAPGRVAELGLPSAITADVCGATPRWNITPSQLVHAAVGDQNGVRSAHLQWGLIPFWAKDASVGRRLANARAESVRTKPSFRRAFAAQRAVVFADLFFEWQAVAGARTKQPWCVHLHDNAPFLLAAVWEQWTPPAPDAVSASLDDGGRSTTSPAAITTCSLITTAPNAVMSPIHSRMPVLLSGKEADVWLDTRQPLDTVEALLRPADANVMTAYPVSTWVNSPAHDDARCVEPLD